jgi:RHS repeat-associated protein
MFFNRLLTETRPDGGVTVSAYDAMNRNTSVTDPAGQTTQYAYGGTGFGTSGDAQVRLTDARGNAYNFTYDLEGRRTSMLYPGGSHEDWAYDAVGNVLTSTTRSGQAKTCTYDVRNRNVLCDWSDTTPDVAKTYDAAGRLLTIASSISVLSYTYDGANQMLSETQDLNSPVDLPAKAVSYAYNADQDRTTLTYPNGTVLTTSYTGRNQIRDIAASGPPPLVTYTYDASGNREGKTLENGTNTAYTYDDAGRLANLDHKKGAVSLQRFDYTINAVGKRSGRAESNGGVVRSDVYGYDPIDQLTQVKYNYDAGAGTQDRLVNYSFDAVGNRTTVTDNGTPTPYTANALNQYMVIDSLAAPSYDSNGNLTTLQTAIAAPVWTYTYDAQNRLIAGTSTSGSTFSFAYDARNRCVVRTVDGTTTCFLYDDWNVIEDRSAGDAQLAEYFHGATMDEIVAVVKAAGTFFQHHDGLGTVTALTDNSGDLVERYTYDVFGTPAFWDATGLPLAQSSVGNRFLFTGREWIPNTGLYDYRNRMYSQELGRFLQTDPIRFDAGDDNIYRYVKNDAIDLRDPSGLKGLEHPLYGFFCGPNPPGTAQSDESDKAEYPLDEACRKHDKCYGKIGLEGIGGVLKPNSAGRKCDRELCRDAWHASCKTATNRAKCIAAKVIIMCIFCVNGVRPK